MVPVPVLELVLELVVATVDVPSLTTDADECCSVAEPFASAGVVSVVGFSVALLLLLAAVAVARSLIAASINPSSRQLSVCVDFSSTSIFWPPEPYLRDISSSSRKPLFSVTSRLRTSCSWFSFSSSSWEARCMTAAISWIFAVC
uniref:Putative secreted peptide n=1 Tax=Anopheles braziliensis TaxID=58242 RepID=A0A2M3ZT56_9DIPT